VIKYGLRRWAWVDMVCSILRRARNTSSRLEALRFPKGGREAGLFNRAKDVLGLIFPEVGPGLENEGAVVVSVVRRGE